MRRAKKYCETHRFRFTEPRERVLSVLLASKKPMGAYEVLAKLSSSQQKVNPQTVYRAIDFWMQQGFIHKVESANAYVACCQHRCDGNFYLFICERCHDVMELLIEERPVAIETALKENGLVASRLFTEIHGRCRACCKRAENP